MTGIKINIIHLTSKPGGIETLLPGIIDAMNNEKFKVFVLRPAKKNIVNVYTNTKNNVTYGSDNNLKAFFLLWLYARRNRLDIFHVFNIGPLFLFCLRLAGVKKIIYSIHGTKYWKRPHTKILLKILWKLSLSSKTKLIANSSFSKNVFLKEVENSIPVNVVYNPIYESEYKKAHNQSKNPTEKKIIYAGRLAKGKNLVKWILIAKEILKVKSDYIFEIYGIGPLETELKALIENNELQKKLKLMGYHKDMIEVYSKSNILLFLSEYESFGNVVVESILCGTPVIASDIPSIREIFGEENYPLVPLDDNLTSAVIERIENFEKLQAISNKLQVSFKTRFSVEQHIEKLNQIYIQFND
jgi:glycosyltransferase involved in cell wall biosynthesis